MDKDANAAQKTYWTDAVGEDWVALQKDMDKLLAPAMKAVLAVADLQPGMRVLDVGCGTGALTRAAALAVGESGSVTGLDISATMLGYARQMEAGLGAARIDWLEADAQTHRFAAESFDAVVSRFGVMFFADPAAAFTNLHRATATGGRFVAVAWRGPDDSPYFRLMGQARTIIAGPPPPTDPHAPGPMAFADEARIVGLMTISGWTAHAKIVPVELVPPGGLEGFLNQALRVGPMASALKSGDLDSSDIPKAQAELRRRFEPLVGPDGRLVISNKLNLFLGRA